MKKDLTIAAFVLALIAFGFSIFVFGVKLIDDYTIKHPKYDMVAMYDEESKVIFWQNKDYRWNPNGVVHIQCSCGNHEHGENS